MDREIIATGLTVDEALDAACEKLGVSRDDVTYEVLEMPKKKFFGLKTIPAKVKVVLQEEYLNKFAPKEQKKPERKPKEQPQKRPAPEAKPAEKQERPAEKAPEQKKPQPQKPQQKKEQPKNEPVKEAAPAELPAEKEEPAKQEYKEIDPAVLELKGGEAAEYIKSVLIALGHTDANVTYTQMLCSTLLLLLRTEARVTMSALCLMLTITAASAKQACALMQEKWPFRQ